MTSYIYDMVDTWNAGATTFTAVKMNVTDTASAAGSLLMDLQVGGSSRFSVSKFGVLTVGNRLDAPGISVSYLGQAGTLAWSGDTFITRRAAANLRLGAADAAAPVAQTLSVQSVVAGTTNTAGANLTITGSQGTGTGAGGSIVFQVAPAGLSGPNQNALADALTIASDLNSTFLGGIRLNGSIKKVYVSDGNVLSFGGNTFTFFAVDTASGNSVVHKDYAISFGSTGVSTPDVFLRRDAANTLALRNGANAQTFRVYNTTDGTNSEFLGIIWSSNRAILTTATAGTGVTNRDLYLQNDQASQNIFCAAPFKFSLDNTYDIGATSSGRPRNVYVAGSLYGAAYLDTLRSNNINNYDNTKTVLTFTSGSDNLLFATGGTAPRINFCGTTSSFPAIKRSSTTLQARLADDSGFASVQGKLTADTNAVAETPTATHTITIYDAAGTAYKVLCVAA